MIDKEKAIELAYDALRRANRGEHTVEDVWYDATKLCWKARFRPVILGMKPGDIVDDSPLVIVDSQSGSARIVDMMSPPAP